MKSKRVLPTWRCIEFISRSTFLYDSLFYSLRKVKNFKLNLWNYTALIHAFKISLVEISLWITAIRKKLHRSKRIKTNNRYIDFTFNRLFDSNICAKLRGGRSCGSRTIQMHVDARKHWQGWKVGRIPSLFEVWFHPKIRGNWKFRSVAFRFHRRICRMKDIPAKRRVSFHIDE